MINTQDFQTKTYLKSNTNCSTDKAWVVALDIGYSSVKGMSKNSLFSFPSFASRRIEEVMSVGDAKESDIQYRSEDGVVWDVGELAVSKIQQNDNSITEDQLYSRNRYNDPMFLVLARVGIAIGLYGFDATNNNSNLVLQTGLPPAYLRSDAKLLKKILTGKHEFYIKIGGSSWKKYSFYLSEDNIKIMGQPMGSLFSATYADDGTESADSKLLLNSNVLIYDGGFGTLDTFAIMNRQVSQMHTFNHLGMRQVLHRTTDAIFDKYDVEIAVSALQNNLGTGNITRYDPDTVSSISIQIADLLESANKEVCMESISQIRQIYNNLIDYKYLLVTGGTGDAWFEMIKDFFSKMQGLEVIPANRNTNIPQIFSNVRGYYLYCVNKMNRS